MKKRRFVLFSAVVLVNIYGTVLADDPLPVHTGTRILHSGNLVVELGRSRSVGLLLE